jgi:hypothetical protein
MLEAGGRVVARWVIFSALSRSMMLSIIGHRNVDNWSEGSYMDNYFSAAVCTVKNQNLTPCEYVFEEYNTGIEKYNTTRLQCHRVQCHCK